MANMITCKVCSKDFDGVEVFHKHLKLHRFTQAQYYQTYYPRYDAYDGTIIRYKNRDYYFSTFFNSKSNFKRWLAQQDVESCQKYVVDFLTARKSKKSLTYALSQVELKTLMMPGIKYINERLGGYDTVCQKVGLLPRFAKARLDAAAFKDVHKKVIYADTREQKPLDFENLVRKEGLSFGDYRMNGSEVYIERKSIADAWGTLSGGFERFEREIIRAKDANAYLVILVEGPFTELERFPMQRQIGGKIRLPVECIYHSIRELSQKYHHIQFLFVKSREEASRVIQKLFAADSQVKDVDLQLLYDTEQL